MAAIIGFLVFNLDAINPSLGVLSKFKPFNITFSSSIGYRLNFSPIKVMTTSKFDYI